MEIRQGQPGHLEALMNMIARCVRVMNESGNEQWGEDYPSRAIIADDLNRKAMYTAIVEDGQVLGMMVLDENQDEQYGDIAWKQPEGPNLIMHRLAVDPHAQGRGVASRMIAFAEQYAQDNGYRSIRLDTYMKNVSARGLYDKLGYEVRGTINYRRREAEFPVYEKVFR